MLFQWYLFALLVGIGIFAVLAGQTYTVIINERQERRYGWLPVLMIAIPLIFFAATRSDTIGDTYAYMLIFRDLPSSLSAVSEVISEDTKDPGFIVASVLLKSIIGNNVKIYFGIIAAICIFSVVYVYRKYSCNFIISIFLFIVSSDYIQWTHNGIRQFIAVAVIFSATDLLLKKKYIRYVALILLMSTIHASALLMIPISLIVQGKPWNKKTIFFTIGILVIINFPGPLNTMITDFMSDSQYSGEVDQYLATGGTNILRVLVFCIPPVLSFLFRRWLINANTPILNLSANMSIVSMGMYIISSVTSGLFIGRLPIYFSLYNYMLLPWIVEHVFEQRSQKLVYASLILSYLLFYYYQTAITWGL